LARNRDSRERRERNQAGFDTHDFSSSLEAASYQIATSEVDAALMRIDAYPHARKHATLGVWFCL
jgi:hypothetical protein